MKKLFWQKKNLFISFVLSAEFYIHFEQEKKEFLADQEHAPGVAELQHSLYVT